MKRHLLVATLVLLIVVPLVAQTPKGWTFSIDRSTMPSDPDFPGSIRFTQVGAGFHAINPHAATYWNPSNIARRPYALKGTFTLLKPSNHTNYYGLVFGGSELGGPKQTYIYFMVAQDGTWLVRHRVGDRTQDLGGRTRHTAVKVPDASGKSTNVLEVRVMADHIDYIVNGTTVHSTPKKGLTARTDGIWGFRINHQLEVQVDGLAVEKP